MDGYFKSREILRNKQQGLTEFKTKISQISKALKKKMQLVNLARIMEFRELQFEMIPKGNLIETYQVIRLDKDHDMKFD